MELVRVSGLEIAYERVGEGPPLVFVAEYGSEIVVLQAERGVPRCRPSLTRHNRARDQPPQLGLGHEPKRAEFSLFEAAMATNPNRWISRE